MKVVEVLFSVLKLGVLNVVVIFGVVVVVLMFIFVFFVDCKSVYFVGIIVFGVYDDIVIGLILMNSGLK